MDWEVQLEFLSDVLKKNHIYTRILSLQDTMDSISDSWPGRLMGLRGHLDITIQDVMGTIESATKYIFTDELGFRYVIMELPDLKEKRVLFIGPYLASLPETHDMLEMGERLGLAPSVYRYLQEYYLMVPVLSENDHILTMIDTFCERLWKSPTFSIIEIDRRSEGVLAAADDARPDHDFDETLVNIERMERRYAFENEMIRAVSLGQQHKVKQLLSLFDGQLFEMRVADPIRNAKNYCIIMNTLLRKAAEQGGVHPLYIDRISSEYAHKIEMLKRLDDVLGLMKDMFSAYCRLVRKQVTKQYSPVVKNAIIMIDSDISANISLQILAEKQGITPEYLATVFKKETGKTVMEYVRDKRMQLALYLLNTTNLQIQTIAMHCGIIDVQYFSKVFKKETGKTPKEYRKLMRG